MKHYLGDGVYVLYDGYHLLLITEDGINTTNRIWLDPNVLENFIEYVKRLREKK